MFLLKWIEPNLFFKYNLLTTAVHNFYYIMSNGVHVPPTDKDDDTNEVSAIGKDTFSLGNLEEQSGVVLIGRGVLKNAKLERFNIRPIDRASSDHRYLLVR